MDFITMTPELEKKIRQLKTGTEGNTDVTKVSGNQTFVSPPNLQDKIYQLKNRTLQKTSLVGGNRAEMFSPTAGYPKVTRSIDEPTPTDIRIKKWQEENIPKPLLKAKEFVGETLGGNELVKAIGSEIMPIFRGISQIMSEFTKTTIPEKSINLQQKEFYEDTPEAFRPPESIYGQTAQTAVGGLISYGSFGLSNVLKSYDYLREVQNQGELKDVRKIGVTIPKFIPEIGGSKLALPDVVRATGFMRGASLVEKMIYKAVGKLTASSFATPLLKKISNPVLKALGKFAIFTASQVAYDYPVGYIEEPRRGMTRSQNAFLESILGLGTASLFRTVGKGMAFTSKGATSYVEGLESINRILNKGKGFDISEKQVVKNLLSKSNNLATKLGIVSGYLNDSKLAGKQIKQLKLWENIDNKEWQVKAGMIKKATNKKFIPQIFKTKKFEVTKIEAKTLDNLRKTIGLEFHSVKPDVQLHQIAQSISANPEELFADIKSGKISDAKVLALSKIVHRNQKLVTSLSKKLKETTDPTARQTINNEISMAESMVQEGVKNSIKGGTEFGRGLRAYSLLAKDNFSPEFWLMRAQRALGETAITKDLITEINKILDNKSLPDIEKTISLIKLTKSLEASSFVDNVIMLRKVGMLTRVATHESNILSTANLGLKENIAQLIATPIDKLTSLFTGKRTITTPDVKAQFTDGISKGYKESIRIWKYGISSTDLKKWNIYKEVITGNKMLDTYAKITFRGMAMEDQIPRSMALVRSLKNEAVVKAINAGDKGMVITRGAKISKVLKGKELADFLYKHPTNKMNIQAIKDSEFSTFNNNNYFSELLGNKFQSKASAKNIPKIGDTKSLKVRKVIRDIMDRPGYIVKELAVPFKRTPTNVVLRIFDYSPFGLLYRPIEALINGNQREFVLSWGRGIEGLGTIALGYHLRALGLASGSEPDDPDEKAYNEAVGILSNAILVNGKWLNLNRISPDGNLLSLGADMQKYKDEPFFEQQKQAAFGGIETARDQSFMRGVSSINSAMENPEYYGQNYLEQLGSSFIPGFISDMTNFIDPRMKNPEGMIEAIMARLPFLSKSISGRTTAIGEDLEYEGGAFKTISPFYYRTNKVTPELLEIKRLIDLGYSPMPKRATSTVTGIPIDITEGLTDKEKEVMELDPTGEKAKVKLEGERLYEFRKNMGDSKWFTVKEFINSSIYKYLSNEEKANQITQIQRKEYGDVKEEFFKIMSEERRIKNIRTKDQLIKELQTIEGDEVNPFITKFKKAKEQLTHSDTFIENLTTDRAIEVFKDDIDIAVEEQDKESIKDILRMMLKIKSKKVKKTLLEYITAKTNGNISTK